MVLSFVSELLFLFPGVSFPPRRTVMARAGPFRGSPQDQTLAGASFLALNSFPPPGTRKVGAPLNVCSTSRPVKAFQNISSSPLPSVCLFGRAPFFLLAVIPAHRPFAWTPPFRTSCRSFVKWQQAFSPPVLSDLAGTVMLRCSGNGSLPAES